jgi:hypothetical protein
MQAREKATERTISKLVALLLCTSGLLLAIVPKSNAIGSSTYLLITPSMHVAQKQGELFNIAIDVNNVENLRSYQFTVAYDASLLKVSQVSQGSFFPTPPKSYFKFDNNTSLGLVEVNCSLSSSVNPVSGNGTLALITFEVVNGSSSCLDSPLKLVETLLLDSNLVPIAHDSVGAVYFWKSMEPDPPSAGLLDVYTQRGGKGPGQPSGSFTVGKTVDLISNVTYSGNPVQQKLVAFQVENPLGEIVVIRTAITDKNGLAAISFAIPIDSANNGTWSAISTVDIAGVTAWDTITFQVFFVPVGGFSVSMKGNAKVDMLAPYHLAVLTAILAFVAIRRKARHV